MPPIVRGALVALAQVAVLLVAGLSLPMSAVVALALAAIGFGERHLLRSD